MQIWWTLLFEGWGSSYASTEMLFLQRSKLMIIRGCHIRWIGGAELIQSRSHGWRSSKFPRRAVLRYRAIATPLFLESNYSFRIQKECGHNFVCGSGGLYFMRGGARLMLPLPSRPLGFRFPVVARPRFWQLVSATKTCCQNPTMRLLRTQELILWVNCLFKYDIFIFIFT